METGHGKSGSGPMHLMVGHGTGTVDGAYLAIGAGNTSAVTNKEGGLVRITGGYSFSMLVCKGAVGKSHEAGWTIGAYGD